MVWAEDGLAILTREPIIAHTLAVEATAIGGTAVVGACALAKEPARRDDESSVAVARAVDAGPVRTARALTGTIWRWLARQPLAPGAMPSRLTEA